MSLITCPECGRQISDKAVACPHCGCPVNKPAVCSECGEQLPDGVAACPNCGCPVGTLPQPQTPNAGGKFQPQQKSKPMIPCLVGVGACMILSFILCAIIDTDVTGEVTICYSACSIVLLFLTPSVRDYIVCTAISLVVCSVAGLSWTSTMLGAAVIVYITHLVEIIVLAVRRSDAINYHRNDDFIQCPVEMRLWKGLMLFVVPLIILLVITHLGDIFAS